MRKYLAVLLTAAIIFTAQPFMTSAYADEAVSDDAEGTRTEEAVSENAGAGVSEDAAEPGQTEDIKDTSDESAEEPSDEAKEEVSENALDDEEISVITDDKCDAKPEDLFLFEDNGDGVTITGYKGTPEGNLEIPDTLDGKPVTAIGNSAFYNCYGFNGTLVIPESVKTIGDDAFCSCDGLTGNLIIPDSVTEIGKHAFSECDRLDGVLTMGSNVTTIGEKAFYHCKSLKGEVSIPESVNDIGEYAFRSCNTISSLQIPDGVTWTGKDVFMRCTGIETIKNDSDMTLPASWFIDNNYYFLSEDGETITFDELIEKGNYTRQDAVHVTGMSLDKTSVTLKEGAKGKLTYTITPEDASNKNIRLTSSDPKVVSTVTGSEFTITLKAGTEGEATVTATTVDGGYEQICKVTVTKSNVPVTKVTLNKTTANVVKGKTITLKATVSPKNASKTDVKWKSSDTSVAVVDKNGVVTGRKKGKAKITVTTVGKGADGKTRTAQCEVTVKDAVKVTGITLNRSTANVQIGKSITLTPTITPKNATNKDVTWKSSNTKTATVDNGVVTGVKAGTVTITATTKDGGKKATCKVTVIPVKVKSVKLNLSSATLKKDKTVKLRATVSPSNASNKGVTWESSNPNVATVSSTGVVKGLKKGTVTITVKTKDGNKTAKCKITVK